MADKMVTLSESEWQQLVAIIANATGFMTFQKLLNQLQRPDGMRGDGAEASRQMPGDGTDYGPLEADLPASLRRVPRT